MKKLYNILFVIVLLQSQSVLSGLSNRSNVIVITIPYNSNQSIPRGAILTALSFHLNSEYRYYIAKKDIQEKLAQKNIKIPTIYSLFFRGNQFKEEEYGFILPVVSPRYPINFVLLPQHDIAPKSNHATTDYSHE